MATIIDGKRIAGEVRAEIAKEAEAFEHESGVKPGLAVIIAGMTVGTLVSLYVLPALYYSVYRFIGK